MSDKDRKKKDGHDTNKDRQAMHEAVKERHERAHTEGEDHDEGDYMAYKSGSPGDRSRAGAT